MEIKGTDIHQVEFFLSDSVHETQLSLLLLFPPFPTAASSNLLRTLYLYIWI